MWDYEFTMWLDEQSPRWNKEIVSVLRLINRRVEMTFNQRDFNDFRENLAKVGFTLREISRKPHEVPEIVL